MNSKKTTAQLASLKKQNRNLPALFHYLKPQRREFYMRTYKVSRMINLDKYGTKEFIITPFYKKISRIFND